MAACRRLPTIAQRSKTFICRSSKFYSTGVNVTKTAEPEIVIPHRIQREPTDILKALASTISKDFTAPQYKYEDDPYFIPASNVAKRAFALSKESGKKAARYFLEKHPELFKCNTSVPHIKAFDPPIVYTEENVSSEDVLRECINNFELDNSVLVYDILKMKGIAVNQSVKQELLELLCFYNGVQPIDEDYYEERYFQRPDRNPEKWNAKGFAETLFEEMEKDSKAYSALISGAAKFRDANRAMYLFEEMKNKELTPTIEAYNGILSIVPLLHEMGEHRWECAVQILTDMHADGLVPNLFTMNAILENLTKNRKWRKNKDLASTILVEMKRLNIEPSLGSYSCILKLYNCDDSYSEIGALYEVLDKIEGQEFSVRHPLDVTFFQTAMEMCFKLSKDKDLAYRINRLLEHQNNCKLLGNAFSESLYFKNFLAFLCEYEDLDKFMEVYEKYVPNTYTPEPSVMLEILQNIHLTASYKYLPKLCSDVLVFEQTERENILSLLMEAAGLMKHEDKIQKELVEIVWKIFDKLSTRMENSRRHYYFQWTGEVLGNILNTFIYGKDLEKSWSVMELLIKQESEIVGYPEKETLLNFCELFVENNDLKKVTFCIKYAMKGAYPNFNDDFKKLVDDMLKMETIETKHRPQVDAIVNSISGSDGDLILNTSSSSDSSDSSDESSSSDEENEK